jgi:hypothetical protein
VNLGNAASSAVIAGNAVTSTNLTTITGNVAISPGHTIRGFPPGTVEGETHIDDQAARDAAADALAASNDAATRKPTATISPNIGGGGTLGPGVYDTAEHVFQLSGTLTLDAGGDIDAVFIFQATRLTTARVSNIDFINGAQPDNLIWQVGDAASLGAYSTFRGNLLALNDVRIDVATAFYGRAIAIKNVVTLTGTGTLPATRVTRPPNAADGSPAMVRKRAAETGDLSTTTSLSSSPNPSRQNQLVTFKATVNGNYMGTRPANKVLFKDGSAVIGSALLDPSGVATFATSELTRGVHPITAVYVDEGTAVQEAWVNFQPSESAVLDQQVLSRR